MLDQIDLSVFPEDAVSVLVGVRNRIAMAISNLPIDGHFVGFTFDVDSELNNLGTIRRAMGMGHWPVRSGRKYLGRPPIRE
ncbi:MAG: hypothetical protein JHD15_19410 [Phenylobacterium sp.]|uniref:hypothetical protein n=1 Tax=Phenylobacterium sp. TaxID=1871053 RepID=UPI001A2C3461|nr:hypothetical protein [Phenylobacterium sp.]MBJ7412507.1 hypothetical protein [Phenylobacterium sp.]